MNNTIQIKRCNTEEVSWTMVKYMADRGRLDEIFKPNDTFEITLQNGAVVTIQVLKDLNGKLFFIFQNCLFNEKKMNLKHSNKGGWAKSVMRQYLNTEIFVLLPEALQKIIKPTKITQVLNGRKIAVEDKLFLPSKTQIFGKNETSELVEPDDAPITPDQTSLLQTKDHCWWLRTPSVKSELRFCSVAFGGEVPFEQAAGWEAGVVPMFCI